MTGTYERKEFKGAAKPATLQAGINATATSMTITTYVGWPDGTTGPFVVCLDRGTTLEEKVLCTSRVNGAITIETRGYDDTTAVAHSTTEGGVEHVIDASTLDQANRFVNLQSAKGDVVAHDGTNAQKVTVGTNEYVLTADSTATSGVAWAQVDTAGIADDAVTTAKIADDQVTGAKIAHNTITATHINAGAIGTSELQSTTVSAGTYGSATNVGVFTVDGDGRLTSASSTAIAIPQSAVTSLTTDLASKLNSSSYTASDVLTKIKTVDGDSSGLDADKLDGQHGSYYSTSTHDHSSGNAVMIRGKAGNETVEPNATGFYTFTHGLNATVAAAFVNMRTQTTGGSGGGETVIAVPITNITNTELTVRLYEIDSGSGNTSGNVSTIFTNSAGSITLEISWLVIAA